MANTGTGTSTEGHPEIPEGLLEELRENLDEDSAPFLRHLGKHLRLEWLPAEESRLGMTRFEHNPNESVSYTHLTLPTNREV